MDIFTGAVGQACFGPDDRYGEGTVGVIEEQLQRSGRGDWAAALRFGADRNPR